MRWGLGVVLLIASVGCEEFATGLAAGGQTFAAHPLGPQGGGMHCINSTGCMRCHVCVESSPGYGGTCLQVEGCF